MFPLVFFLDFESLVFNSDLILVGGIFISTVEVLKYSFSDLKRACCLVESLK